MECRVAALVAQVDAYSRLHISERSARGLPNQQALGQMRTSAIQTVGTVPPSMAYSVPVMEAARGETRKAMRSATSFGLAGRPSGMPPRPFMMIYLPPS
jgi:hypothetical protein